MVEPKVRLTLLVPGAGLVSQQVAENKPKRKKRKVKTIKVPRTAKQSINLSKEAYDYMVETPTEAKFAKIAKGMKRKWDLLTVNERLKHHFNQIAHDLRAISYSYEVLGD